MRIPQVDLAIQGSRCQQLAIWPVRQGQHIVAVLQCFHSSLATAQNPFNASRGQQISAAFTAWIPLMRDKGSLGKQPGKDAAAGLHSCGNGNHLLAQAAVADRRFETQAESAGDCVTVM